ncbi:MAG: lysophospholipid acyltransferase family protein [Bacteroidota bacterium]
MPGWSGKSRGGALGYRFFIFVIKNSSIRIAYLSLRFVAFYYLLFTGKASMRFYFRTIHGYTRWRSLVSIYRSYCLLGETLIDKVAMLSGAKTDYSYSFEGEEHLRAMSQAGRGGVLIGAHMGNWEMAGQLLERIDTPVNIVMLEAEHEKISRILNEAMVHRRLRVIPQKADYSHLFLIDEALKRSEFVVIHGDRYLPGTNTVSLPFLGREARFPQGPLYLASKHGLPVSFVYTLKERHDHYHFYASPGRRFPYPAKIKTRRQEISQMVASYVESLETMVKRYPLQWFNYYPFWNEEYNGSSKVPYDH